MKSSTNSKSLKGSHYSFSKLELLQNRSREITTLQQVLAFLSIYQTGFYHICIMNAKSYTYHSPSTKSFTCIDLSFCHSSLFLDYNWSVCEDQHNSDHFPIIIEQNTFSIEDHNPKWKLGSI